MTQSLWYVRRNDKALGPYPAPVIVQYLVLGRLSPESQVSLDGQDWFSIRDSGYFQNALEELDARQSDSGWDQERDKARKRWLDERENVEALPASAAELRGGETAVEAALRQDHQETRTRLSSARRMRPAALAGLVVLLLIVVIAWVVFMGQPDSPVLAPRLVDTPDCAAAPANGVVWRGCDKRNARLSRASLRNARMQAVRLDGAELRGAQLAYANLSQAVLRGADLSGADLTGADLTRADLSGANLTDSVLDYASLGQARLDGARLQGARLDKTGWLDGRQCAEGSVGECR